MIDKTKWNNMYWCGQFQVLIGDLLHLIKVLYAGH